ncbi:unnamed protein product [Lasius platythorax]|uniref:Uncharacterized protein n=2 Tax=Lasius TaxID=488720 RepID=A0A0J7MZ61_LASNI|nr:hypothetical protein RF55_15532 [Lasius niger]
MEDQPSKPAIDPEAEENTTGLEKLPKTTDMPETTPDIGQHAEEVDSQRDDMEPSQQCAQQEEVQKSGV